MSQELLKIFTDMNYQKIETQIAMQCSPVLTAVKVSNILIVDRANKDIIFDLFYNTDISCHIICETAFKTTFLLYVEDKLSEYIGKNKVKNAMALFGYEDYELDEILEEFSRRYHSYDNDKSNFPHEIGLLLGYPVEDVFGFIENSGKNFLYTGYWKVYNNVSDAIKRFNIYDNSKETVIKMLYRGISIKSILDIYYPKNINKKFRETLI